LPYRILPSRGAPHFSAPYRAVCHTKSVGNDAINLRIGLSSVDDLGTEALAWLRRAYDESK
jgi:hypothetical protein